MNTGGISGGVALSNVTKPPSLYGMNELILDDREDVLKAFAALSVRNTEGTGMNDSSSRSHCFAWLTLHVHDQSENMVTTTRFQFCDLAGSERASATLVGPSERRKEGIQVQEV